MTQVTKQTANVALHPVLLQMVETVAGRYTQHPLHPAPTYTDNSNGDS